MKYKVKLVLKGYSYVDILFEFDDRNEALDFAETAFTHGDLSDAKITLIREEDEDE